MRKLVFLVVLLMAFVIFGCGGDDISPTPEDVKVDLYPDQDVIAYYSDTIQFNVQVFNTHDTRIKWLLDGVEGGNDSLGTIDTLGEYIAPASAVSFDQVILKVISQADTSKSDSVSILILDPLYIFVDSTDGDDSSGTGSPMRPYRTITEGLRQAISGQTVQIAAGTYVDGEAFPISPNYGISIRGAGPSATRIEAPAGTSNDQAALMIQYDRNSLHDLTITGSGGLGVGINFASDIDTSTFTFSNCIIEDCYRAVAKTGQATFLSLVGTADDTIAIRNCTYGLSVDEATDSVKIFYCKFEGIDSVAVDLPAIVDDLDFEYNLVDGARIAIRIGAGGFGLILKNTFMNISEIGVEIALDAYANLGEDQAFLHGDNHFENFGSGNWCIRNDDNDPITAIYNWWPAADSAGIDSLIYDDEENSSSGPVDFAPWNN